MSIKIYPVKDESQYYKLFIHNTLKSLRGAWDLCEAESQDSSRSVLAFTLMESAKKNCIGEIHITARTADDIVNHECLHALLHWGKLRNLNIYHAEETFCYVFQVISKDVKTALHNYRAGF